MTKAIAILADDNLAHGGRRFHRYSETSDSAIPFVRRLPSHWHVEKLKHVASVRFSSVNKKTEEGESPVRLCNYTDVYNRDTIIDDPEFMQASATTAEIARHTLKKGDVLITKDSEAWNDIAVPAYVTADMPGILCGYHLAHIRPNAAELDGAFLSRAFSAEGIREQFHIAANGITRFGLPNRAIAGALFPVPPLDEQRAIAAFLDFETAKIDELIAKKHDLIRQLVEKRKGTVAHATTKGLDHAASMKNSGIPWFGMIPCHWDVTRLGWVCSDISDINHEMPDSVDDGVPFLSAKDLLDDGTLNFTREVKTISEDDFRKLAVKSRPCKHDIIYSRIGACLGKARLVENDTRFLVSYSCCVVRLKRDICDPGFFRHLLDTDIVLTEAKMRTQGIGVPDLGLHEIGRIPVPVPPIDEQKQIAQFLNVENGRLRKLIQTVERGIDALQNYRSSLISSAVAGQIDVRNYRPEAPWQ